MQSPSGASEGCTQLEYGSAAASMPVLHSKGLMGVSALVSPTSLWQAIFLRKK